MEVLREVGAHQEALPRFSYNLTDFPVSLWLEEDRIVSSPKIWFRASQSTMKSELA